MGPKCSLASPGGTPYNGLYIPELCLKVYLFQASDIREGRDFISLCKQGLQILLMSGVTVTSASQILESFWNI